MPCAQRRPNKRRRSELFKLRMQVKQLTIEREILSKTAAWFDRETDVSPRDLPIHEEQSAKYRITTMYRVLGVSASGYHAWSTAIAACDCQPHVA